MLAKAEAKAGAAAVIAAMTKAAAMAKAGTKSIEYTIPASALASAFVIVKVAAFAPAPAFASAFAFASAQGTLIDLNDSLYLHYAPSPLVTSNTDCVNDKLAFLYFKTSWTGGDESFHYQLLLEANHTITCAAHTNI